MLKKMQMDGIGKSCAAVVMFSLIFTLFSFCCFSFSTAHGGVLGVALVRVDGYSSAFVFASVEGRQVGLVGSNASCLEQIICALYAAIYFTKEN